MVIGGMYKQLIYPGYFKSQSFTKSAMAETQKDLVFNTQNFSPFSYKKDGVVSGPVAEIIRGVCYEMNVNCHFKLLEWSEAQQEVKDEKAHAMFVIGWNKKRAKWLHFSDSVVKTEYGFFVRSDSDFRYNSPESIEGKHICVYGPSNTYKTLLKLTSPFNDINLTMTKNSEISLLNLADSKCDTMFSNKDVGVRTMNKLRLKTVKYAGSERKLEYYIGFNQKLIDKAFVERFNHSLKKLDTNGVIGHILAIYNLTY
jgi:polar amino acid transport system substrate-binding protein